MVLAFCEPSRFQGSAVLGGNILSGVAFSAEPGHTFCCVVREEGGSGLPTPFFAGCWHGELSQGSCWWAAGLEYRSK